MKISKYIKAALLLMAAQAYPMVGVAADVAAPTEISVQDSPSVKVTSQGISIDIPGDTPKHVAVYALTGQIVKDLNVHPGTTQIELKPGHYIVRIDRMSFKVVVK